jgi:hypothetical protein
MWKDIILWKYERASWQWDVLCVLILVFIFLTPKSWFDKRERLATQTTQVTVKASELAADERIIQKNIRDKTGNPSAEIVSVRELAKGDGNIVFEVEVR